MSELIRGPTASVTTDTGKLRFNNGSFTSTVQPNSVLAANNVFTLPATTGTVNQILRTDASGASEWVAIGTIPNAFVTAGANVGGGAGIFRDITSNTINLRTLVTGSELSAVAGADTVSLTANTGSTAGTLCAGNDARLSWANIVNVKKNPGAGEFSSINAALASITTNAANNPFLVLIGPGVYIETTITLKPYVFLQGSGYAITIVMAASTTQTIMIAIDRCSISNMQLNGASGSGGKGIYYNSTSGMSLFTVFNCAFGNCETCIHTHGTMARTLTLVTNCKLGGPFNFTTGFLVTNAASMETQLAIVDSQFRDDVAPYPVTMGSVTGTNANLYFSSSSAKMNSYTGTCFVASDGATLNVNGSQIIGYQIGINVPNTGAGPNLKISVSNIENNTINVNVENPATTGYLDAVVQTDLVYIHPQSLFAPPNGSRNLVYVANKSFQFTTISGALAWISPVITIGTTNLSTTITSAGLFNVAMHGAIISAAGVPAGATLTYVDFSNATISSAATATASVSATIYKATVTFPFVISVDAGYFTETQTIVLPSYVTLMGVTATGTLIQSTASTCIDLTNVDNCCIRDITLIGPVGAGTIGIEIDSCTDTVIKNSTIVNTETPIYYIATLKASRLILDQLLFQDYFNNGIHIDGTTATSNYDLSVIAVLLYLRPQTTGNYCILVEGPHMSGDFSSIHCRGTMPNSTTGVVVQDGATFHAEVLQIEGMAVAFSSPAVGLAPNFRINVSLSDNTIDISQLHPTATGSIIGTAEYSKVTITSPALSVTYNDSVVPGFISPGAIYFGDTNSTVTNCHELLDSTPGMGKLSGGDITGTGGLGISVSAGLGYLMVTDYPVHTIRYITWSTTPITLIADTTNYIYVNNAGVVSTSGSRPDILTAINLGSVRATSTPVNGLEFINKTYFKDHHGPNHIDDSMRYGYGAAYVSGSLVTADGSRQLAITSGEYYIATNHFVPAGQVSPATWWAYYHVAGSFVRASQTVVDNAQYDNMTALTPIPASEFAKHSLYICGDGSVETYMLVYAQATYATLLEAQVASLPLPPSWFISGVVSIASIIVQQGVATVAEVRSERPIFGQGSTAISGTTDHGSLSGLADDDHLQYLLVNGTRAMSGNLSLGSNQIVSVSTVNGVVVEAHGSRHLPSGADPLTTAAPITALTATGANAIGTANSFARSDHVHAVSTGAASSQQPNQANATGTSANLARADHVHNIPTGVPVSLTATGSNSAGSAATFAASDHVHAVTTGAASTQTPNQANATGVSANLARADHVHNIPTAVPVSIGAANATGSAPSFAASDHVHQGVHSVGTTSQRFGDITLAGSGSVTITESPSGTFTFSTLGAGSDFIPTNGGGLTLNYTGGKTLVNGVVTVVAAGSILLTNAVASGAVYAQSGSVTQNATGLFPSGSTPIATFTTAGGAITVLTDVRSMINTADVFAAPSVSLTSASTNAEGTSPAFARADHSHAVVLTGYDINTALGGYPLGVSKGGTGVTTLTAGNVLVGAGTSAVVTTKAAPSGAFVGTTDTQTLTNKTLDDTTTLFQNTVDITKQARFDCSTISTGTTRVYSLPDLTTTLVGTAATQTLTNKTMTSTTNNITSNALFSATTTVNVSAATAPTTGQILTATSGTAATWQTIARVTSVDLSMPAEFTVSGNPITSAGTFVVTKANQTANTVYAGPSTGVPAAPTFRSLVAADIPSLSGVYVDLVSPQTIGGAKTFTTAIAAGSGGTGISSYAVGDLLAADTTSTLTRIADVATGNALISGGVGVLPTWGKIDLTAHVTGVLPVANGGTGVATLTAGNVLVGNGTSAITTTKAAPSGAFVGTTDTQTMTNKSLVDASTFIIDDVDATKRAAFECSSITTGTTRTLTVPDANLTIVGTATTQTLTNKTLTATTNNITANALFSATTTVNVSASAAPATGNILVATSATAATWQAPSYVLGLTVTAPIVNTGTAQNPIIGLTTPLDLAYGGTGSAAAGVAGAVVFAASTTAYGQTAAGSAGQVLVSAGAATPVWSTNIAGNAGNVSGVVAAVNGGTGQSSYAVGDLLAADTTTTLSRIADVATGNALISGGVSTLPTWGKIGLTTHIAGILPVANGGTGVATLTSGNVLVGNGTGAVITTQAAPTGAFVGTTDTQTLTNKSLVDASTFIIDDVDVTKRVTFECSSITTGTTRTLTVPDASLTIVGTATTQTLTNKTLTATTNNITSNALFSATTTINVSAATAPTAGQVLTATSGTAATWQTPTASVTNVTASSPLASTGGTTPNISIASVIPIALGGTNSSAALNNGRLMWSAAGEIVEASALANGQIFIGSSGLAPVAATIAVVNNLSVTNGAGAITITSSLTPTLTSINVTGLTASLPVQTDASKNLISAAINLASAQVTGVLPVANGGTGVSTLTAGNVLVGNGTSAVVTTKAAPSGAFVGDTDTQTLTNKTLTSATNVITASALFSATTTVGVSAATAPTAGQALVATSGTTATWQSVPLSNTATVATSNNTPTTLDTFTPTAPTSSGIVSWLVVGRNATNGNTYSARVLAGFKVVAGTASIVGRTSTTLLSRDDLGTSATAVVSGGNVILQVVGHASQSYSWKSQRTNFDV